MTIEKKIEEKFEYVNKAYFEKEMGMNFLRVEVSFRDINEIIRVTNEVSNYLDEIDKTDSKYYLDIFSPGTDEEIKIDKLKDHIGEYVQVELNSPVKTMMEFIGEIISVEKDVITVKWNAKGQFRKQELNIDNIKKINKYAKINKKKK